MADVEIKRGYEVLPDNDIRFGIRITNVSELAISDVEVILDYVESLFKLEGDRMQKVGVIPPANTRTAEFVLKPLGCVHKVNIEALISYRDAKYARQRIDMHPKEVHCVCPFLKGKAMPRAEFLELSGTGHSAETGLNFKGVDVERLTSFLVQTCKSRHYKVDDFSIDGGRMLYLASESIGEKAYYLLTALVKESRDDGGLTQVMLRAVSDKPYGLNGFLNETVADLRHVVSTVQSAQEIGIIKKEQVINIIDSVVQRTSFGGAGGEGGASVNIQDSVVQRTEFDAGADRRVEEERLRNEQEERNRKEEEERLRSQKEEEDRKAREEANRERQEKERLWQEKKEKQRKEREEQEELRKKQEDEKEILRKQKAQKAEQERKAQSERERIERERNAKVEREIAAKENIRREQEKQKAKAEQERIARQKGKSRTNVFMLVIVLGALLVGFVMFAPGSGDTHDVSSSQPEVVPKPIESTSSPQLEDESEDVSGMWDSLAASEPGPDESTPAPSSSQKTYTNSIGMDFVLIPAGSFDMESPSGEDGRASDESPVHKVKIPDSFYMGKYEVTQKQWREVMGDNPSYFKGDDLPVEKVSWNDAQDFIKKLNQKEGENEYRLPSEAEWEYAARAGTTTQYSFGDDVSKLNEYAWYRDNSGSKTHPVGQKKPNFWGLYDMHGNVWEWVQDKRHGDYDGAPTDGSAWESGRSSYRVFRGGSWSSTTHDCRSASRSDFLGDDFGFRLLMGT